MEIEVERKYKIKQHLIKNLEIVFSHSPKSRKNLFIRMEHHGVPSPRRIRHP